MMTTDKIESTFIDGQGDEITLPALDDEARQKAFVSGWAHGEALNNAIWEAAWFAVERNCDRDKFVATIIKAANEAFDSQVNNAAVREKQMSLNSVPPITETHYPR